MAQCAVKHIHPSIILGGDAGASMLHSDGLPNSWPKKVL
jgi:hypothetical protein